MPKIHPSVDALLSPIVKEWNSAERSYKRAEQLGSKVAIPSINEARYAGRKIVEVIILIKNDADPKVIEDRIRDVRADLHRAHHDAIDAGIATIGLRMKIVREEVPAKVIREVYPEYINLVRKLSEVNSK